MLGIPTRSPVWRECSFSEIERVKAEARRRKTKVCAPPRYTQRKNATEFLGREMAALGLIGPVQETLSSGVRRPVLKDVAGDVARSREPGSDYSKKPRTFPGMT